MANGTVMDITAQLAWTRGVDLACEMLADASWDTDERVLDDSVRDGRPQDNFVYDFLCRLRELNDPRVDIAFAAVLSDFIAGTQNGAIPDIELLFRLASKPVAQRERAA